MAKAVIFDLDGTLLYTLEDLMIAVNKSLSDFGFRERTLDEVRNFVGNGVVKLMERSVPGGKNNLRFNDCLEKFYQYYSENVDSKTRPYDGVMLMLEMLKMRGVLLAVNSNKYDAAVKELCKMYFPQIEVAVGAREGKPIKPSAYGVESILNFLQVDKKDAYFVGDSFVDIETAKNAGIKSIGVTWGYRPETIMDADFIVKSPGEILKILSEN